MKNYLFAMSACALLAMGSCKSGDNGGTVKPEDKDTVNVKVTGDISSNTTWTADKKYTLNGPVYVTDGATLTIMPGTVIFGDKGSKGSLVVTRGSKINASGTASQPIVFTSKQEAGARREGDWGGLIILGKAPVNPSGGEAKIEGGLVPTNGGAESKYIFFGGADANDNSGTLKYVRIEFAGIAFSPDNEINGLTMGGVGAGTTISYVQVYRSGDDSYEWFGGTVNCDHLIASYGWDDDFDTDFGYSGNVQFCVSQRVKTIADQSGSNGFESDNDGNGSSNAPQTAATFSNMTIIGPVAPGRASGTSGINANYQHGAQIRRNSTISIVNSIITGFPIGLYIDDTKGTKTSNNVDAGTLKFRNNILAGNGLVFKFVSGWANAGAFFAASNTDTLANTSDVMFVDAFKFSPSVGGTAGRPNYTLAAGSPALTGASFTGLSGFTPVAYRGAFDGSNDWTLGWTSFDAENTKY